MENRNRKTPKKNQYTALFSYYQQRGTIMVNAILRLPAVKARTGLSRSTIYLRISNEEFPHPISLGGRAVGWLESDINDWLDEKIKASRTTR